MAKQTENLSFGSALAALKEGKKVKRAVWEGYWFRDRLAVSGVRTPENPSQQEHHAIQLVLARTKEGSVEPAQPYWKDMMANDWQILSF